MGRQTDPWWSAAVQIRCRPAGTQPQKGHRVVHYVSSVCRKPQSQNKSEVFILSHRSTSTECLTGWANNTGYNLCGTRLSTRHGVEEKPLKNLGATAAMLAVAGLLTGCGVFPDDAEPEQPEPTEATTSAPADPSDEFQSLQVHMVAQSGTYFPDGVEGVEFGCSDTLVTIHTVPIHAETSQEHVASAIQFLLDDSQYYHGSPAVTNSLTLSETLQLSDVEVDRNSVHIALTGDVVAQSECEAYRIQAQLYGTAASTAGIQDVSITVDDVELNDALGLESFDTGQLRTDDE